MLSHTIIFWQHSRREALHKNPQWLNQLKTAHLTTWLTTVH